MEYEPLKLTHEERNSVLWTKIEKWAKGRIEYLRAKNDNDAPPEDTARLRGQIREAKALVSLGREQPQFTGAKPKP